MFSPPPSFNLADYLLDQRIREGQGDRVALRCHHQALTYSQLQARANRYAGVLQRLGVKPEQRVIVALPDGFDFAAALLGILKAGAVGVMVNPDLGSEDLAYMLSYSRAPLAIIEGQQAARWAGAPALLTVGAAVEGQAFLDQEAQEVSDQRENTPTHRDDPALWIFSGGTTGRPKAAVQPHRSFANTTECYARAFLGYTSEDVTLAVPKLYFGYALGCNLFFPLSVGATACLFPERSTPESVYAAVQRHRPTILVNVPTMVHKMLECPQDLSCLRLVTSAGEALPPSLYQRWRDTFGVELLDGLGTAEMWHIFLSNAPGQVRPGSLGRAVPGFELKVSDDAGVPVPDGEVGRLWVRGGSRALLYFQRHEASQEAFQGEWYASQDLVRRDPDGYFHYCGRGDELLKVAGQWVAPQEVEDCLLQHPAVRECALVGLASAQGLVKPRAYVVSPEAGPELAETLKLHCQQHLAGHKQPREVVFVESLPRTHLGKVDRGKLRTLNL